MSRMKKNITRSIMAITILNLIIISIWLLMPDPTANLFDFQSLIEESKLDSSIKRFQIATPLFYENSVTKNNTIPFWIRYHPRRKLLATWRGDFIGIGYKNGMYFSLGKSKGATVDIYAYNIKLRICAVDMYYEFNEYNLAQDIHQLIRNEYPFLPIYHKQYK